jgi:photosynthesis system II assembly factor YCF48-like protein/putative zinc finger protein
MNRELPKPIQEALTRQTAGDVHPSADALTAFVEQSLPQRESQHVTAHLAQCADCREVVFLANSAVEEQELLAVPVKSRALPTPRVEASPRRGWRLWWAWAPAVAAVLVVAGIVLWRAAGFGPSAPMRVAVSAPSPGAAPSEQYATAAPAQKSGAESALESSKVPVQKPAGKLTRARTNPKQPATSLSESVIARNVPEEGAPAPAALPKSLSPQPADALGFAKAPPAAYTTHNSLVESQDQTSGYLPGARPQMAMRAVSGQRSQWRVTAAGHLERSIAPGSWTPALSDQPTTFHVVSVVGNNVWAGGSGGALFHSSDGGQDWSKQPLADETGAIVSIRFGDAAHGIVTTDAGSQWSTSDGGVTWTKE